MKKFLKPALYFIVLCFVGYVIYRNVLLHTIPSVDLIKDENTSSLYQRLLPNTSNKVWKNFYYSNDYVELKDIPDDMRFNIAYKNTGSSFPEMEESTIENAYNKTFGPNTYKRTTSFIGGCNTYIFDSSSGKYVVQKRLSCDDKEDISIISKIIDASVTNTEMSITLVIAYIDSPNKKVYTTCNKDMSSCDGVIKENIKDFDEANLDEKNTNLHKYQFVYKSIDDEYYFSYMKKLN